MSDSERPLPRPAKPLLDLQPILDGWDFQNGTVNVRRIVAADGSSKIQMRLDLGVLQMEESGRPDGQRPNGCESLLDYHEQSLRDHLRRNGTELGYHLTRQQCRLLRDEAAQYYQRYVSLFVLEEFDGVVRDTGRSLRVLELCRKYAVDEYDRVFLEQYRPYILMMNARASAALLMEEARPREALRVVDVALRQIRAFFTTFEEPGMYDEASEVRTLRRLARDIRRKIPVDPIRRLHRDLQKAVKVEDYETAARIRDQIARLRAEAG